MELIFKYDFERLTSYAVNADNNIEIADEDSYIMLSFPEVAYFNYAINVDNQPFTAHQLQHIDDFYRSRQIAKHKVIVPAGSESSQLLKSQRGYKQTGIIAKTFFAPTAKPGQKTAGSLQFVKANEENIARFTDLYLQGFGAVERDTATVCNNFKTLLNIKNLDLFLIKHKENFVGVNLLYKTAHENLLAGGAVLPQYRNKGFHKEGLAFRIQQSLNSKNIVAWAYKPSISLNNMLKLNMEVQKEFYIYESCK